MIGNQGQLNFNTAQSSTDLTINTLNYHKILNCFFKLTVHFGNFKEVTVALIADSVKCVKKGAVF